MEKSKTFSHYAIIFNPNSTGDAPAIAKESYDTLIKTIPKNKISMMPTEHAGHAKQLAHDAALHSSSPLIISVSGDGGYNEVINGVLKAQFEKKDINPTVSVIGAGNANDHYRVVHRGKSLQQMLGSLPRTIDLIKVTKNPVSGKPVEYYAHSYVGVGMTPKIAEELNRNKLNPVKEAQIILNALFSIRPTRILKDNKDIAIDSLIFANISQMAKVLTLTDDNSMHDGQFELIEIPHTNIFGLLMTLLRAATIGLKKQPKYTHYSFTLNEDHPLQIDGELMDCKKGDGITISVAKDAVQSLI